MDIASLVAQSLMMALTTVVSAALGWVSSKYKAAKQSAEQAEQEQASIKEAVRLFNEQEQAFKAMQAACIATTGDRLDALCDEYKRATDHEPEDTQALVDAWQTYHDCGGDGARTARVERLTGMHLEE